jgi:hypothetical protein
MSKLPLLYPEQERNQAGRRVVLRVFSEKENPDYRTEVESQLSGIAHKIWNGKDLTKEGVAIIMADLDLKTKLPKLECKSFFRPASCGCRG